MMYPDETVTRAQILHAAHHHPGSGHVCAGCLAEAVGETRRNRWWRLAGALLAVAVLVVMCGVVPSADAEVVPPVPAPVTITGLDLHGSGQ